MSVTTTPTPVESLQVGDYFRHFGGWYLVRGRAWEVEGRGERQFRVPAFTASGASADALVYGEEVEVADERPQSFSPASLRRKAKRHREAADERLRQADAVDDLIAIVNLYQGAEAR